MKISVLAVTATIALLPSTVLADQPPPWIGNDQIALLAKIGVDPENDVEVKGNYHWRWRAKRKLVVGGYSCPAGSAVDVARSITLVISPQDAPCTAPGGGAAHFLKIFPDGSAEPLAGST